MKKKSEVTTSSLEYMANDIRETAVSDEEQWKFDITNNFWEDTMLRLKSQNKELINIQLRGFGATGKSTVADMIMAVVNTHKQFLNKPELKEKLDQLILLDQVEFIRFRKMGMNNVMVVIDELNRMNQTGFNATTEQAQYHTYSDIFTQNFVHRINCTTSEVADPNAYLVLDVKGRDLVKKETILKVRYRDITEGQITTIGHIRINVADVLNKPWYLRYREKKFARMRLLESSGIRDIRDPEFAIVVLAAHEKLKELAEIKKVKRAQILGAVDEVLRERGIIYSILATDAIGERTSILLETIYEINKESEMIRSARNAELRAKAAKAWKILTRSYEDRLKVENGWAKIYNEYLGIGDAKAEDVQKALRGM